MGLNGSFIFSPQISSVETGPEPPSLGPAVCGRNHGLDKITETQKKFILRMVKARSQEFFNLHGFEMGLLSGWQSGEWFSIDQVDFVVAGSSDDEAQLEGSYQKIVTKVLKIEENVAFSFKMSVSTEADADVIYFVFSYPDTEKKYSPERPLSSIPEKTIESIEVMPAPNGIYVSDQPPNSYVLDVGMKVVKLFVEKELENKPDFLESLLKGTDEVNQRALKAGFLKQLQASLPFTWSEEMIQDWLYDEASKHHALNDSKSRTREAHPVQEKFQKPPEILKKSQTISKNSMSAQDLSSSATSTSMHPVFTCEKGCGTVLNLLGRGLNGSFMFSQQIKDIETAPYLPGFAECSENCGLNMITETQKNFILAMVRARSKEFFESNGFEMSLLNSWQDSGWFPIDQVDLVVTGLSDVEAKLEGSYQKLLTQFLEVEKKLAFSFKMRVGQEADSDAIYFVLSYPQKFNLRDKKNSTELPLLTWEDF